MISLFYRLRLLNYILGNLKDVAVKLFLLIAYFYTSSIVLTFLSNGSVEFSSLKSAFDHLYRYCKWYYDNRNDLGYGISIRILVAFLTPHFLYKSFLSTGWKSFLKEKIIQILRPMIGKKGNKLGNKSRPGSSSYSSNYSNKSDDAQDARRKVNMIKQLLIKDIEETIDKRLNDIFFSRRSQRH